MVGSVSNKNLPYVLDRMFLSVAGTEILKPSSAYQKSDFHGIFLSAFVSLTLETLVAM